MQKAPEALAGRPGTSDASDADAHPDGAPTARFPLAENAPNVPLAASTKSPVPRPTGFGVSDTLTPSTLSAEQLLEEISAVVAELKREKREVTRAVEGWRVSFKLRSNKSSNTGDVSIYSPDADVIRSVVGLKRKLGVGDAPTAEALGVKKRPPAQRPAATDAQDGVEVEEEEASTASDDTATVPVESAQMRLQEGARVLGRFCASRLGTTRTFWYAGVVTAMHADGTCAIRYDDGDDELVVYPQFVRRLTAKEAAEADAEKEAREGERREEARRKQEEAERRREQRLKLEAAEEGRRVALAEQAAERRRVALAEHVAVAGRAGAAVAAGGGARRHGAGASVRAPLCGAELATSQELIGRIATYLVRCGAPPENVALLLEGWSATAHRRGEGVHCDHYYYDASGKKFRSRLEIARHFALATSRGEHCSLPELAGDSDAAGQRRYSATEPPKVGDRVKCRWMASTKPRRMGDGLSWYPGVVLAVRLESRCLVAFDDGDYEDRVLPQHMRPLSAEEAVQADAALAEDDWAQTPATEDWNRTTYVGEEFQVEVPPWAGPVLEHGCERAEPVRVVSREIEEELARSMAKRMTEVAGLRDASLSGVDLGDGRT